jgi:ketol-acid reductoisomerase
MREVLDEVRSGHFARKLHQEAASGYPTLNAARARARSLAVEQARRRLES